MRLKPLLLLFLLAITVSCSAKKTSNNSSSNQIMTTDSIIFKAVGDSIYHLLTQPKTVEISSLPLQSDSVKQVITKRIPSNEIPVIKFIVTNPKNFLKNTTVYGVFTPQCQVTLSKKRTKIILKYDFGLRKWGIFNEKDETIAMFDLSSDNMLRFASNIFPENQFFYKQLFVK